MSSPANCWECHWCPDPPNCNRLTLDEDEDMPIIEWTNREGIVGGNADGMPEGLLTETACPMFLQTSAILTAEDRRKAWERRGE
tara:strand:- start:394 stop:645 length:252 start_codon:yes stop_codon:yes gene_type:complete